MQSVVEAKCASMFGTGRMAAETVAAEPRSTDPGERNRPFVYSNVAVLNVGMFPLKKEWRRYFYWQAENQKKCLDFLPTLYIIVIQTDKIYTEKAQKRERYGKDCVK